MLELEHIRRFGDAAIDPNIHRSDHGRLRREELRLINLSRSPEPTAALPAFGAALILISVAAMCVL